jgi:hypothetical protein
MILSISAASAINKRPFDIALPMDFSVLETKAPRALFKAAVYVARRFSRLCILLGIGRGGSNLGYSAASCQNGKLNAF